MRKKIRSVFLIAALLAVTCMASAFTSKAQGQTRIHFIAIEGQQDAILLESNGHFGMVDSGEDTDYPDGSDPRYPGPDSRPKIVTWGGSEAAVINYLRSVGVTKLDFYIGTHAHSDHIGSADEILEVFGAERIYLREYDDSYISNKNSLWDNLYCYDHIMETAARLKIPVVQNFTAENSHFTLEEMTIDILNTEREYDALGHVVTRPDDNYNALAVKVSANGLSVLLAADINNYAPTYIESKVASQVGKVDLLKLAHHGLSGSNSSIFLNTLNPQYAVVTGPLSSVMSSTSKDLQRLGTTLYSTNGLPANSAIIAYMNAGSSEIEMAIPGQESVRTEVQDGIKKLRLYNGDNQAIMDKDSWILINNNYYLTDHEGNLVTGWKNVRGKWYYMQPNGIMVKDVTRIDGKLYSFNASGAMSSGGWTKGEKYWSFANSNGICKTGWVSSKGSWYYMDADGTMGENEWVKSNGKWYYLRSGGKMAVSSWLYIGGIYYYVNASGVMQANTWIKSNGIWYYLKSNGSMAENEWIRLNGKWYYLSNNGRMIANGWSYINDKYYYFDQSGVMKANSWVKSRGIWYYLKSDGSMAENEWIYTGGKWYYLSDNGKMLASTTANIDGVQYTFNSSGAWVK